ncbi:OpgC domain-containing protein [Myxococcus sp. K15C18031901]|uniref:OpgC domain-containing protein n=1 Tax=Myxococcus dinghuensis TaxID=2906761 RepID=UPI0020A7A18B|nr:OpgC domain-containing protein [Myxococcus dinghuensis]MCP3101549.1 OpgC domain-containing protein [Myxococcus dinghuensis]
MRLAARRVATRPMQRRPELDALRGILLVLMTLTHLPTRLNAYSSQPLGFISAAEGFVFLSAFLVGVTQARPKGPAATMWRGMWKRALKVYRYHVGLLAFAFAVIGTLGVFGDRPAIRNLLDFFHREPLTALWSSLVLLYCPPLLDILPLYVVLLALTPLVLTGAHRFGWARMLVVSGLVWLAAQVGLKHALYDWLETFPGSPARFDTSGAFDLFAWQFLWVVGVWRGARHARSPAPPPQRHSASRFAGALVLSVAFLLVRYEAFGLGVVTEWAPLLFDKWTLGALRLLNFGVVAVLVGRVAPPLVARLKPRVLAMLGSASLPVFATHLVLCLLSLALINEHEDPLDGVEEFAVLVVTFAIMLFVAFRHQRGGTVPRSAPLLTPGE